MVEPSAAPPAAVPFAETARFWLRLGFIGFGGPAGQIALMHAELVERRRWISERRFLHALNYCMLLPGPEAQQLATYLGWLMHRTRGALVAGTLFVLPSLLFFITLGWAYLRLGELPLVAAFFQGLKPAVTVLVLQAALRIGTRVLRHPAAIALAAAAFVAVAAADVPFPAVVAAAALLGWLISRRWPAAWTPPAHAADAGPAAHGRALIDDDTPPPAHARPSRSGLLRVVGTGLVLWLAAMALLVALHGVQGMLAQMGWFFTKAALLSFGGAYAVLPYVHQGAVETYGWLDAAQMMDGLALGQALPGPLIMIVSFVGFVGGWQAGLSGPEAPLLGAALAAGVATFFTFLPSFVFILAGGPLVEATRDRLALTAPLAAIAAAVVGVILSLALFFAQHTLWPQGLGGPWDGAALLIGAAAAVALWRWRVGVVPLLLACGGVGVLRALL